VTGASLPTEAPRDCAVPKPERTHVEQSGRKGIWVRSRRGERAGSGGFWSRQSAPNGSFMTARWMI
jgi:hypothetical protein